MANAAAAGFTGKGHGFLRSKVLPLPANLFPPLFHLARIGWLTGIDQNRSCSDDCLTVVRSYSLATRAGHGSSSSMSLRFLPARSERPAGGMVDAAFCGDDTQGCECTAILQQRPVRQPVDFIEHANDGTIVQFRFCQTPSTADLPSKAG